MPVKSKTDKMKDSIKIPDVVTIDPLEYFRNDTLKGTIFEKAVHDIEKSGISFDFAVKHQIRINANRKELNERLGMVEFNGNKLYDQKSRKTGSPNPSTFKLIEFPHFEIDGNVEYYSYKCIPELTNDSGDVVKYLFPVGKPIRPYIVPETWKVKHKANQPIWITEGAKKGLCLSQYDRYSISLGGVWNFRSNINDDLDLLRDLNSFDWKTRTVYLGFDGDLWTNSKVRAALYELAFRLYEKGALVKIATWIGEKENQKGIDDYLSGQQYPKQLLENIEKNATQLLNFIVLDHYSEVIRALSFTHFSEIRQTQVYNSVSDSLSIGINKLKKFVKKVIDDREKQKSTIRQTPNSTESKSDFISYIRNVKGLLPHDRKKKISNCLIDEFNNIGRFLNANTGEKYWFNDANSTLYRIDEKDENLHSYIGRWYGLNPTETEYKYLIAEMISYAINFGIVADIHRFGFYDKDQFILYLYNNANHIYKINGEDSPQLVNNGCDGVFFLSEPSNEPFEHIKEYDTCFNDIMIDPINFQRGEHVVIDQKGQKRMFVLWFYSLFFESLQTTKPLLTILGEAGSGKTSILRHTGKLLFGSHFDVTQVKTEADFDVTVSNSYYVGFDNVDSHKKWLEDSLACAATGHSLKQRALYMNNKKLEFESKCFVALGARTPKFKREDVIERLLLFRVAKRNVFDSENKLNSLIKNNRNFLMSEIMHNLTKIVYHLRNTKNEPFETVHRMADFAFIAGKIDKVLFDVCENGETLVDLLDLMKKDRREFLFEDNEFYEYFNIWINADNDNLWVSAGDLYSAFSEIAETKKCKLSFKNSISLGVYLKNILDELKSNFTIKTGSENNRNLYHFMKKPENS